MRRPWRRRSSIRAGGAGPVAASIVRTAALRASAAAALVLDLEAFGFPDDRAIDRALERGIVD